MTYDSVLWPLEKIERNFASAPRGRRCVLLSTGGLNPVHLGHVAMFDRARSALEVGFGFEIVGGFLSPSHDHYLEGKGPEGGAFSSTQRLEMCTAATRDHEFLAVGAWESTADGHWRDFPEVTAELERVLEGRFGERALEVMYLCGEDHFRFAKGTVSPLCVIPRARRAIESDEARGIYAIEQDLDSPYADMSSTRVRKALLNNDIKSLSAELHPDVLELLVKYRPELARDVL